MRLTSNFILQWHLVFSLSLIFIGEYTTTLFIQSIYLLSLNNRFFIYLYIPMLHFGLVKLFASSYYPLYFLNIFILLLLLKKEELEIEGKKILFFLLSIVFIYFITWKFDEFIYDIYLFLNIDDKINSISYEVVISLIFLHLLILFIYGFKNNK